jgi:ligand-binding SRPBCC domain-containing protein
MARYRLERRQNVGRPIDEVFAFFSSPRNLEQLTPPSVNFRIVTPQPVVMQAGALIDYEIHLYGVPLRWRSSIEIWEPRRRFVDLQVSGPYRYWRHEHLFTPLESGTEIRDVVDYDLPYGPLGTLVHWAVVRSELDRIFDFRANAYKEAIARSTLKAGP